MYRAGGTLATLACSRRGSSRHRSVEPSTWRRKRPNLTNPSWTQTVLKTPLPKTLRNLYFKSTYKRKQPITLNANSKYPRPPPCSRSAWTWTTPASNCSTTTRMLITYSRAQVPLLWATNRSLNSKDKKTKRNWQKTNTRSRLSKRRPGQIQILI